MIRIRHKQSVFERMVRSLTYPSTRRFPLAREAAHHVRRPTDYDVDTAENLVAQIAF